MNNIKKIQKEVFRSRGWYLSIQRKVSFDPMKEIILRSSEGCHPSIQGRMWLSIQQRVLLKVPDGFPVGAIGSAKNVSKNKSMTWVSNPGLSILRALVCLGWICNIGVRDKKNKHGPGCHTQVLRFWMQMNMTCKKNIKFYSLHFFLTNGNVWIGGVGDVPGDLRIKAWFTSLDWGYLQN